MKTDYRELTAGLLFIALGVFVALYASSHYEVGEPARMGPGFFPVAAGWVLALLGVGVIIPALRGNPNSQTAQTKFGLRPLLAVPAAVLAFGLIVEPLGLIPATLALTAVVVFSERPIRLRRTILLGIGLAAISWLVFIVGLKMTLPAFNLPG